MNNQFYLYSIIINFIKINFNFIEVIFIFDKEKKFNIQ